MPSVIQKLFLFKLIVFCIHCSGNAQDLPSQFEKGNTMLSATFHLKHSESENEPKLFQTLDGSYTLDWGVDMKAGKFIKKDFVLGGGIFYDQQLKERQYEGDNGAVTDDLLSKEYGVAPYIRNYLPIGNGRFSIFNETSLQFTYGRSVRQIEDTLELDRYVVDSYGLTLGLQPGISVFITKNVGFELGTSVLGISSTYSKGELNGDGDNASTKFTNQVSFEVDLLKLFLGVTFYLPPKS
jgi:hypothetical protein